MTPSKLDKYLAGLTPQQQKTFARLVQLLGKRASLDDYHASALAIIEMQPSDDGYGSGWMVQLCQALASRGVKISPSLGYRLLKFAAWFPGTEGKSRVQKLDDKIRWDSMMRILHVEDLDQRESILRTAVKGGLSTRAVRKLIAEKTTYRRPRGGRPPAGPEKHPNRALRNLLAFTIEWPVVCGAWLDKDDRILKNAARFKSGQMTDDYLEDLARVVVNLKKMTTSTKKLATQLASLLGELQDKEGGSKT